ncbi:haloacid dehalogenase [Xylariaceae sp. FL1019]|nr:haloacid dehalogenase [Xylariaceae sp. FL1019]
MSEVAEALKHVKALTFDVFGTVVDWRSTVHNQLIKYGKAKIDSPTFGTLSETLQARLREITDDDWAEFAQAWRDSYIDFVRTFIPGQTKWKDIDTHHHDSLVVLMMEWGVSGAYTDQELRSLSLIWHFLKPWPDSALGIQRLGTQYVTCTLSNGNRSLLDDLNTHGNLGFRRIISSADYGAYKPHPSVYLGAADSLGCQPHEVAMVAAHLSDLNAARQNGLRTIYVERHGEGGFSSDSQSFKDAREWVDLWVSESEEGFVEVARKLGVST